MKVGHSPFTVFQKELVLLFFSEHLNRKCSTAAPHDSKPFITCFVELCHIFPISRSPWNVWKCIQAHILFLLLVSDGDFQPESKEKSHKHNVSLTQKQNLCQEHFLLNRIRPIFIWSHGCKTMKECRHTVWFLTTSYRVVLFFWIGMFMYKGERSAGSNVKFTLQHFIMLLTCPVFIHSGKKGSRLR